MFTLPTANLLYSSGKVRLSTFALPTANSLYSSGGGVNRPFCSSFLS